MPPEEFYPAEYTQTGRQALDQFLADFPESILIGGWASWARVGALQSHDIDAIVGPEVLPRIAEKYGDLTSSNHPGGKKWRGELRRIHLDLYVPYQSRLGRRLRLKVEDLTTHAEKVKGWRLLSLPAHLATKFAALLDRPESHPGEKDRIEIWGLLQQQVVPEALAGALRSSEAPAIQVVALVGEIFSLLEDLDLTRRERHRLRQLRGSVVEACARVLASESPAAQAPVNRR